MSRSSKTVRFAWIEDREVLGGFCWEVLLKLESVVDVNAPILLLDEGYELVDWLHLSQLLNRTYQNKFLAKRQRTFA